MSIKTILLFFLAIEIVAHVALFFTVARDPAL